MELVGVKELKAKITYYLKLAKEGEKVIVTDRGNPIAILSAIGEVEKGRSTEERLASLAKRGILRLPVSRGRLPDFTPAKSKGKPASEMIIEDRR